MSFISPPWRNGLPVSSLFRVPAVARIQLTELTISHCFPGDTGFTGTLPSPPDIVEAVLQNSYSFVFLNPAQQPRYRDLKRALLEENKKVMLELVTGFTLMGSLYHLEVVGKWFYVDILPPRSSLSGVPEPEDGRRQTQVHWQDERLALGRGRLGPPSPRRALPCPTRREQTH